MCICTSRHIWTLPQWFSLTITINPDFDIPNGERPVTFRIRDKKGNH